MGIDIFGNRINKSPYKVPDGLVPPLLDEAPTNTANWVDDANIGILKVKKGLARLVVAANVNMRNGEVDTLDLNDLARVVKTDLGYIVDRSHSHSDRTMRGVGFGLDRAESWFTDNPITRTSAMKLAIGYIDSPEEFQFAAPLIMDRFGIELSFVEV